MSILDDGIILKSLQKSMIEAILLCDNPDLPVKYIGVDFTPPNDQKWLELVFIPNNPGSMYWGEEKVYRGMLRMILHWPNNQMGAYPPMEMLSSIASYFHKGLRLQNVEIYETPTLTAVLEKGSENLYPASLRYQSFRL